MLKNVISGFETLTISNTRSTHSNNFNSRTQLQYFPADLMYTLSVFPPLSILNIFSILRAKPGYKFYNVSQCGNS